LPALEDSAFVLTEFGIRQGITYQQITKFRLGSFVQYRLAWVSFDERIDLGLRIFDWLGLFAEGLGAAAIGIDAPSVLFQGGGFTYGGKGGAVFRLFRSDESRIQVAVRVYGGGVGARSLDLLGFGEAFAVRTGRDLERIVTQTRTVSDLPREARDELSRLASTDYSNVVLVRSSSWTMGASVHLAQVIVAPLALQTTFGIEQAWGQQIPFDSVLQHFVTLTSNDTSLRFGATASFDFNQWGVPIGVSAEYDGEKTYRTIEAASAYVPSSHYFGGGLFFTGRRGLEIGALFFTRRNLHPLPGFGTSAHSDKPVAYQGTLVFRALW
jgi:hypothetical protein